MTPDDDVLCIEGCGRVATDERLHSIITDGDDFFEVVELVCVDCGRDE